MKKYLRVQMSDGATYDIPADIIAEHRAGYFDNNSAEKLTYHSSSIQPRLYSTEKEFALGNDEILVKWAATKMKWKEIEPYAKKVETDNDDYENEWSTADKKVISE
ncbi:MAG TPA: hypothetical protein VFD00_05030 [Thermoclostridium sp.]|nr:hypothetical protein [Thermoclostridium sp.]